MDQSLQIKIEPSKLIYATARPPSRNLPIAPHWKSFESEFYLCAASLPDRMSHRSSVWGGWRNSDTHFHWPAGAADGSDTYDCHQNISPNETSLSNPGQLTFPKPFARPLVNLVVGHQIIDGRNKIAIPTRPPLISPMTCRLKGWRLFVNLLQIGVIRIMQRPSEKASLAWTNVWIDTHKTKEGEGREKVNVGVLNPLIAARGGYTTQYSKTNSRFLCRLHLLSMTACIMFQQIFRPRFVFSDQTLIVDQGKSSSAEVLTAEIP